VDPFDRRVENALGDLPGPDEQASDRARRAALNALPTPTAKSRRRLPLLMAAALAVGLAGGGAVAAIGGALRDDAASPPSRTPPPVAEPVPGKIAAPLQGAGVLALVDGKLWLATRSGLTIEGLPANAAALSPNARFVVLGIGASLVVMAPDGRRAWSLATPGGIVGAAWAPNPILIAYVVTTRTGNELWLVEGDGDNPRRITDAVAPVTPSWRPDSQAIAFVDRQGRAMVYDRTTGSAHHSGPHRCDGRPLLPATKVAFAPSGGANAKLAFITKGPQVAMSGSGAKGGGCRAVLHVWSLTSAAWISSDEVVVTTRPALGIVAPNSRLLRFRATQAGVEEKGSSTIGPGAVMLDIAPAGDGRLALAVGGDPPAHPKDFGRRAMPPSAFEVRWVKMPPAGGPSLEIRSMGTVLRLEGRSARRAVQYSSAQVAWR
jgi:hypothetical protein